MTNQSGRRVVVVRKAAQQHALGEAQAPPERSFERAYEALQNLQRQPTLGDVRKKQALIRKAAVDAGRPDLSVAPFRDLVRIFVSGGTEDSTAAAREISLRACQGALTPSTGGLI
ncbi:MAG TPA: hypothetical protein VGL39_23300 [Jatrophihabitantaceae bacterium]|jgi:hypothetical protein